jgi:hypothetical protein
MRVVRRAVLGHSPQRGVGGIPPLVHDVDLGVQPVAHGDPVSRSLVAALVDAAVRTRKIARKRRGEAGARAGRRATGQFSPPSPCHHFFRSPGPPPGCARR